MNLNAAQKKAIRNALARAPKASMLGGNDRTESKTEGLAAVNEALGRAGFYLEMVIGDLFIGEKGSRLLRIAQNDTEQPVENCGISYTWENLNRDGETPRYELIVYLS